MHAESLCRQALAQQPDCAAALNLLGFICQQVGRVEEGIELMERSVLAEPTIPQYRNNLAVALGSVGRLADSAEVLRAGIEASPEYIPFHRNLGVTLERLGDPRAASECYRHVLTAGGAGDPAVHTNLAGCLAKLARADEAEAAYRRAIELNPGYVPAWDNLGKFLRGLFRQGEGSEALRHAVAMRPADPALHSDFLYALHYCPGLSRRDLFSEHRTWALRHEAPLRAAQRPHDNDESPTRRLRLGYVSSDFRRHSVATFVEPLLSRHDHEQFEVVLYSGVARPDEITDRFRHRADLFRDISRASDAEAADLIRRDQVDILVDLTGHMAGNRLPVFARKPAPIQVIYVGHPNTTGMDAMDYRLTDSFLDPFEGDSDAFHSEKLIRLPRVFGCYQPPVETESSLGNQISSARAAELTFGCLNNPAKVTPDVLRLWCQILREIPRSRLLLLGSSGAPVLSGIVAESGISPDRIRVIGRLDPDAYFRTFREIDVALDPFPYNGQTTSCDGFWMGVPLVALRGDTYVSRMGADLLHQLALDDLIAHSEQEYVRRAVALAQDRERLAELRRTLRDRMRASALLDAGLLARDVEWAYRCTWEAWCRRRG